MDPIKDFERTAIHIIYPKRGPSLWDPRMSLVLLSLTGDPSSSFYFEIGEESMSIGRVKVAPRKLFLEFYFNPIGQIEFYNFYLGFRKESL